MLTGSQLLYELPAADGWMALEEFSQCEMLQQLQRPHDVTEQSGQTDEQKHNSRRSEIMTVLRQI